jgi:RecA-family ATPase
MSPAERPAAAANSANLAAVRSPAPFQANLEAEVAFLGAVLMENGLAGSAGADLRPHHFSEPLHQRIYERILSLIEEGRTVTPVTLRPYFETDQTLASVGGLPYLSGLTSDLQGLLAPRELAEQIVELAHEREFRASLLAALDASSQPGADIANIADAIATAARSAADAARDDFATLDLVALADSEPRPKPFAIDPIAPLGEVTLLTGQGSAGKSLAGQQMATAAAAGLAFLGMKAIEAPAIYLTCEDDADQVHWRQAHICDEMGVPMADLSGKLHVISRRGALDNELCTFGSDGSLTVTPTYRRLATMLKSTGAKLAVLDNVAHLFVGNENDRGQVTRFVNLLNRLAGETGAAIILIGHPNKTGDSYSGSTAWLNAVRSQATITHDTETDVRTLSLGKANYARKGEAVRFIWRNWAFVREDDLPPDEARELSETVRASADNMLFLACLRERTKQQRAVSEKRGPTFAPTEFDKMVESKGIGKERLEQAMDRLFRAGAIERAGLWTGPDRKTVVGLRETAGNGQGLFAGNTMRETRATVAETAENCAVEGAGNGKNGVAGNGAGNTMRETRETVRKPAENRAGNAGNTHPPSNYVRGRGPWRPPSHLQQGGGAAMRQQRHIVTLAATPPIGLSILMDGQRFDLIRHELHRRQDGETTTRLVWRSECATCGESFVAQTTALRWAEVRRCERHRQSGTRVRRLHTSASNPDHVMPGDRAGNERTAP